MLLEMMVKYGKSSPTYQSRDAQPSAPEGHYAGEPASRR